MSRPDPAPSPPVLAPMERLSEVLFGLIMVLTFTGSLSVGLADRSDVHTMLVGALGCNLAWGLIDGVFYLMSCLSESGRRQDVRRRIRAATDDAAVRRSIAEALPSEVAEVLTPAQLEAIRRRVADGPEPERRARLAAADLRGAAAVALLVFLSTVPVALPFLLFPDVARAMRASNGVAIVMLFGVGHAFGRVAGLRPLVAGMVMVLLGGVLVALTIALGG